MIDLAAFLFRQDTATGLEVLAAGICQRAALETAAAQLRAGIAALDLEITVDPYRLDHLLAVHLRRIACGELYAAGLSLRVPGIAPTTGGIIGDPRSEAVSADGSAEDLGCGLSAASYPGGPGLALTSTPSEAEELLRLAKPGNGGLEALFAIARKAAAAGKTGIIISDGTGATARGAAIAFANGRIDWLAMDWPDEDSVSGAGAMNPILEEFRG